MCHKSLNIRHLRKRARFCKPLIISYLRNKSSHSAPTSQLKS